MPELTPTHILDGAPLVQKTDKENRTYYVDLNNKRIGTKGKTPEPISEAFTLPTAPEPDPLDDTDPYDENAIDPIDQEAERDAAALAELEKYLADEGSDAIDATEAGKTKPVDDGGYAPRFRTLPEPLVQPEQVELPFLAFACACAAFMSPAGYNEHRGYVARRVSPINVELSIPSKEGGHKRSIIVLPETVFCTLVPA